MKSPQGSLPVTVEQRGPVRILTLTRGRANTLSPDLVLRLHDAVLRAQADPEVAGVVLSSRLPRVFSAGFDLSLLGSAPREVFVPFMKAFEALFYDLFLLKKPFVAALSGHAVAGGALLAGTADLRIAAEGSGTIGLPESTLGLEVPRHFLEALRATVGDAALSRWSRQEGATSFREAQRLGAIDQIVAPDHLLDEAVSRTVGLLALGEKEGSFVSEKILNRLKGFRNAQAVLEESRDRFVDGWFSAAGQTGITATLERIRARARPVKPA